MAMLKTVGQGHRTSKGFSQDRTGHSGSCRTIDDYLFLGPAKERGQKRERGSAGFVDDYLESGHGQEHRPLAWGAQHLFTESPHGWSREMDATRARWGKDEGRTYYHFVISADPEDHASAEEMRDVALEWLRRTHPDAQAAVSVHDDNADHVMHAHVIVNSVIPTTGRKVHRSDGDVIREADALQDICDEHGLGALPRLGERRRGGRQRAWTGQETHRSAAERGIGARGGHSWVAACRMAVDMSVAGASSWDEFVARMESRGYGVHVTRRGVTYVCPGGRGGHDRMVRGERMGTLYSREGVLSRLTPDVDGALGGSAGTGAGRAGQSPRAAAAKAQGTGARRAPRHQRVAPAVPGVPGGHQARTPRVPTDREWARRQAERPRRGRGPTVGDVLNGIALARSEGLRNGAELSQAARDARARADAARDRVRALDEMLPAVERARDAQSRAERLRREIDALPERAWSPRTRARRNAMAEELADCEATVDALLGRSAGWLRVVGLDGAPRAERLRAVDREVSRAAAGAEDEARGADWHATELERAVEAMRPVPTFQPSHEHVPTFGEGLGKVQASPMAHAWEGTVEAAFEAHRTPDGTCYMASWAVRARHPRHDSYAFAPEPFGSPESISRAHHQSSRQAR